MAILQVMPRQVVIIIYIYIDMALSIIDMDFVYQLNLRLIAPLFTVYFQCLKKMAFKIFQS